MQPVWATNVAAVGGCIWGLHFVRQPVHVAWPGKARLGCMQGHMSELKLTSLSPCFAGAQDCPPLSCQFSIPANVEGDPQVISGTHCGAAQTATGSCLAQTLAGNRPLNNICLQSLAMLGCPVRLTQIWGHQSERQVKWKTEE